MADSDDQDDHAVALVERHSICLPRFGSKTTLHQGDAMFSQQITKLFSVEEHNALDAVVRLKRSFIDLPTDEYFTLLTESMANILDADMTFVMKRILVDEQDVAIEMPPFGEPGSCMMAAAFHFKNPDGSQQTMKDATFHAYSCPCAFMRHDKVFLIPEKFDEFITENPNTLPMPTEAYIAIPLFAEGKSIGHFGCLWSPDAAARRKLSWAFIEMILHSLEDLVTERLSEGATFIPPKSMLKERNRIIPHEAVSVAQSLRPYAGSLSHELRTPMQGVVGMLDVMYATVQETAETLNDPALQQIFESLKDNIEVVQDSSRRAVEAADNVVHAYDMDMVIPERAIEFGHEESTDANTERRPEILVSGSNLPMGRRNKRRIDEQSSRFDTNISGVSKFQKLDDASSIWSRSPESYTKSENGGPAQSTGNTTEDLGDDDQVATTGTSMSSHTSRSIVPGIRHTNMREVFKHVIDEGLKLGGRPDTVLATETTHGGSVEVRSRSSDGNVSAKIIDWRVDPTVPDTIFIDEKDLIKLVSCVFLNALKFADQQSGRIGIHAEMERKYVVITINDNGPGIPSGFLPKLFKPFSQENRSITRQSDGLGLGLLVAKGIARKLGGDLSITKAETEGPAHGSEFAIKIPLVAGDSVTRPSSPSGSPRPRSSTLFKVETSQFSHITDAEQLASPIRFAAELHVDDAPQHYGPDVNLPPVNTPTAISPTLRDITSYPSISAPSPTTAPLTTLTPHQPRVRKTVTTSKLDRDLALKYPLNFLVAEDNKINRRLLVTMLNKLGYKCVHEAHDGSEAVRQMKIRRRQNHRIDVVLMDLWMPLMDGYEATELILRHDPHDHDLDDDKPPTVLAVTADVTDDALARAAQVGMTGFMTKPYKLLDLQRLITEYCVRGNSIPVAAH